MEENHKQNYINYEKYEEALDELNSTIEMLELKCEKNGIVIEKVIDVVVWRRLELDVIVAGCTGNTQKIGQIERRLRRLLNKKWDLKTLIKFDKNEGLPYES